MELRDVLDHPPVVHPPAHGHVVEHLRFDDSNCDLTERLRESHQRTNLEVLDHLAESDAAGVRADGDAHLGGHQVDGQHVVQAAAEKSAEVQLNNIATS